MRKYSVIDLFAGAGGLSLGFIQTNKYDIKVAFENNPDMQATYRANHPNVEVLGDVCKANYKEIQRKYGAIDVIIGGPPCQGFSNANRQKNHAISQNNMLVKQYLRAIIELQPQAFVMENVSMLRSEVHRFYMENRDEEIIKKCGIPIKETPLHLLDAKFLFDSAIDIVQDETKIEKYLWPEEDYSELNVIYKNSKNISKMEKALEKHKIKLLRVAGTHLKNKSDDHISLETKKAFKAIASYYDGSISAENIIAVIEPAIMIQRMLSKAQEIFHNDIVVDSYSTEDGISANIRSFAVYDYLKGILSSPANNYAIKSEVLCAADYGAPQKRMRFVVVGIKKSLTTDFEFPSGSFNQENYRTVKDAIGDLESITPVYSLEEDKNGIPVAPIAGISSLAKSLRNSKILKNHIITKTTKTAMERFKVIKPGQNFHSISDHFRMWSVSKSFKTVFPVTLSISLGEIPSPGLLNVSFSLVIVSPFLNLDLITMLFRAIFLISASFSDKVLTPSPIASSIIRIAFTSSLNSSGFSDIMHDF